MCRTHIAAACTFLLLLGSACSPSNTPTSADTEARTVYPVFGTGWMGGGGRTTPTDSTSAEATTSGGTGWMGGGGRTDSTTVGPQ